MTLKSLITEGDYIRAISDTGSVIEGQSLMNMTRGGSSILIVLISGDGENNPQTVQINVNFWNVEVIKKNQLPKFLKKNPQQKQTI